MTPSKILFYFCIFFIVGIFLESLVKIPQDFVWAFLFAAVLIILVAVGFLAGDKNTTTIIIFGFCVLFLVLGILRSQISEFNIANDKLSKFNEKGQVVLTGIISNEPDIRDTSQKLKVGIPLGSGDSTILVTTNRYPEYNYLDEIKITGKLEEPSVTDSFNYKNYLMRDHVYSVMDFPKIEVVSKKHQYNMFSFLYDKILFCKQKIRENIQHNFLPPKSSILEGTVLGDNGAMTVDLKNKLNITGLRHIISVSGTHVVILNSIVMSLLLALGIGRNKAFYFAIIFICLYIIFTGLPSSGIRAGIMGGLFLLAQKLGRQSMGVRVIIMACAVMLVFNPLLLLYDVGFQLSFLAVMGLLYLEPLFKLLVKNEIISTTFAAQVFTLPIMVYNFGNISFVSPITNLLVLPIVPELMGLGFLVSIAGIFSNSLGWILSLPLWFLLSYFSWVIDFFSKPWMAKTIANISFVWVFILYFIIAFATRFLRKKYLQNFV